jgi:hypothetical protein
MADLSIAVRGNPVAHCVEWFSSLTKYLYLFDTKVGAKKIGVACA